MSESRRLRSVITLRMAPAHDAFVASLARRANSSAAGVLRALVEREMLRGAVGLGLGDALAVRAVNDELLDDIEFAGRLADGVELVAVDGSDQLAFADSDAGRLRRAG